MLTFITYFFTNFLFCPLLFWRRLRPPGNAAKPAHIYTCKKMSKKSIKLRILLLLTSLPYMVPSPTSPMDMPPPLFQECTERVSLESRRRRATSSSPSSPGTMCGKGWHVWDTIIYLYPCRRAPSSSGSQQGGGRLIFFKEQSLFRAKIRRVSRNVLLSSSSSHPVAGLISCGRGRETMTHSRNKKYRAGFLYIRPEKLP